ncbi:MAG: hypothetical protein Kow0079_01840 [Vicingaceae bacterium]
MNNWEKKGLIFNVNSDFEWNHSHAQVPVVDILENKLRIYYSTRDKNNRSSISYIEVSKENPKEIIYIHNRPILPFGKLGTFDDCGLMPSSIINVNNKKFLYYIGWTTRGSVPYHNAVGLAISDDEGNSFKKIGEGPIITTNYKEPYFSGTSFVIKEDHIFRMYYLSCIKWEVINNKPEPFYDIKLAESQNGIDWLQSGKTVIKLKNDEGGLVSASVIKIKKDYFMWFGKRGFKNYRTDINQSYKIGFAKSKNGIDWDRHDNLSGIELSENGWDSKMISYPYVIKLKNKLLMFYNGNGFGKSGFGYAEMRL